MRVVLHCRLIQMLWLDARRLEPQRGKNNSTGPAGSVALASGHACPSQRTIVLASYVDTHPKPAKNASYSVKSVPLREEVHLFYRAIQKCSFKMESKLQGATITIAHTRNPVMP